MIFHERKWVLVVLFPVSSCWYCKLRRASKTVHDVFLLDFQSPYPLRFAKQRYPHCYISPPSLLPLFVDQMINTLVGRFCTSRMLQRSLLTIPSRGKLQLVRRQLTTGWVGFKLKLNKVGKVMTGWLDGFEIVGWKWKVSGDEQEERSGMEL